MYIEYIKVKYFGIHESAEAVFTDGLITVRGGNGMGKSTLAIQAPLYAMFGATTLDATLQDTVTTGQKDTALRTELKYGPYIVKRSKSSASVVGNAVKISGQAEVSNFFYDLFGIQKGSESLVLVAEQGKTAGILSGKPGEVNSFIEDLAGFDQIDDLIERVKLEHPSGQKEVLAARLEELKERKNNPDSVPVDDVKSLKTILARFDKSVASLTQQQIDMEKSVTETNLAIQEYLKHNHAIEAAAKKLAGGVTTKDDLVKQLESLVEENNNFRVFDAKKLAAARDLIITQDARKKEWAAFNWLSQLPGVDEWDEGLESFNKELASVGKEETELETKLNSVFNQINFKRNLIVTDKNCTLCEQDVTHLHKEINERLEKEIKELDDDFKINKVELIDTQEYLSSLMDIHREQVRRVQEADLEYLVADASGVPYSYILKGDDPEKPDTEAITLAHRLVGDHKTVSILRENNGKRITETEEDIADVSNEVIPRREAELKALGETKDITVYQNQLATIHTSRSDITLKLKSTALSARNIGLQVKEAETLLIAQQEALRVLEADIKSTAILIEEDSKNGKIVKAVRDAKPKVLELVWTKILYSVSTTFSDMVGFEATVEKDTKGFRINGLPVQRLSGSEKTTLGIALRSTLRDIFAPTAGFMFWDECYADCDAERTAAASAVIQSLPVQSIVVTHESDSELASDQFIEIGN